MSPDSAIVTIDTGFHRPRFDAAYLLVNEGRAAFVDCGVNASVPRLLDALANQGLGPEAVDWLVLTHVHLDHAGGAGLLMQQLPRARLLVHPRGARHMADPTALRAGAVAVYGEAEVQRSYGELRPVSAERIVVAGDGQRLELAGRPLLCLDTPGHCRHHLCLWDPTSAAFFTGDAFGLSYRELDGPLGPFILPTTTPVQFDPEAMRASVLRLLSHAPRKMYLTHYGPVADVESLAEQLLELLEAMVERALALRQAGPDRHARLVDALRALYLERAAARRVLLSPETVAQLLAVDIELNAAGIGVWLDRMH